MDERLMVDGPKDLERLIAYLTDLAGERARLTAILDAIPIAVGFIDDQGRTRVANERWNRCFPQLVPSLDPEHTHRWRAFASNGEPLPPDDWPGALALRGQTVSGAHMLYTNDDGQEVWMGVTAAPIHKDGRVVEAICTVEDIDKAKRAEESLRRSQLMLVDHLLAARKLQQTSTQLIEAGDIDALYELILDAASAIMRSDFATMQRVDDANSELVLLGYRGFSADAAAAWQCVPFASASTTCAMAMRTGRRSIAEDFLTTEFMAGTPDLENLLSAALRSAQSTPLQTRDGRMVGVISTHWRKPHAPSRRELANLDVLARQAADLIERTRAEEQRAQLLESLEEERRLVQELPAHAMAVDNRVVLVPLIGSVNEENIVGFAKAVLHEVRNQRARAVVLDVTGVQHVDEEASEWMVKLSQAARMMGSQVVAAGFNLDFSVWRPAFSFSTDGLITAPDVREGLEMARSICV